MSGLTVRQTGEPLWRIVVEAPHEAAADIFALLLETVATAVTAFETVDKGAWVVAGFVQGQPETAEIEASLSLAALALGIDEPALTLEVMPDVDWLRLNQESFPPRRVGRFYIYGSHVVGGVPGGATGLRIDAATAFGTGEHATTSGCLAALDSVARSGRRRHVLDMGTGTGILAIAAAKLWGGPVLACDIDRHSVRVAQENIAVNGVGASVRCIASDGYAAAVVGQAAPYDLIFANILARPLVGMSGDLIRHLAPGGIAILSGLLSWQENYVASAHRARGLRFIRRIRDKDWHTLIFKKPG